MNWGRLGRALSAVGPQIGPAFAGFDPKIQEEEDLARRLKEAQIGNYQSEAAARAADAATSTAALRTKQEAADAAQAERARITPELANLQSTFANYQAAKPVFANRPDSSQFIGPNATKSPLDYIENPNIQPVGPAMMLNEDLAKMSPREIGLSSPVAFSSDPRAVQAMTNIEQFSKVGEDTAARDLAHQEKMAEIGAKNKETANAKNIALGEKESQFADKRFTNFSDALDPSRASSRSAMGQAAIAAQRAERLQSLASAFPAGQLRSQEILELATGMNNMIGGSIAVSQIQDLVPHSAVGNANKFIEWLTNDPTGANQGALVTRLLGSINRESYTANQQLKRAQYSRIAAFSDLQKKDPTRFNDVLLSQGVDPDEYSQWTAGGHKRIDAVMKPGEGAAPGAAPSGTATDDDIISKYRSK
jgi:hypothetical protein